MIHPEFLKLPKGMLFLGYYEKYCVIHMTDFATKFVGRIVIGKDGETPAIDEDGNVFKKGKDFPVFVDRKELEKMDIEWFFELNPMIAALNGL